jgi:hypothetical protein
MRYEMSGLLWKCALFVLAICGEGKLLGPVHSSANSVIAPMVIRDPIISPEDIGTFQSSPYGGQCKIPDSDDLFCGQCTIGCDGVVGGTATEDKCGVCGGFGNTCCDTYCVVAISLTTFAGIVIGFSAGLFLWWVLVSGQERELFPPEQSIGSIKNGGFINNRLPNVNYQTRRNGMDLRRRTHL